jgi:hypothetical protein
MNLPGKSREEIKQALVRKTRDELIDIIFSLSMVEQHFTAAEIASRSGMSKRTILSDIHAGRFNREYYKRSNNQITVSAAGVNAWRKSFRVVVEPSEHRPRRNE